MIRLIGETVWSDRQDEGLRLRVLLTKQAIIRCPPAGAQEQGHLDSEFLFKQSENSSRIAKPTGAHSASQTLPGVVREG